MKTILWTNKVAKNIYDVALDLLPEGFALETLNELTQEHLVERAKNADYILASGSLLINEEVVEAAPNIKMVQKMGVGYESVDDEYLKSKGLPLYVTRNTNAISVAEHTIMLMLAALRRLTYIDEQLRQGNWLRWGLRTECFDLSGKTVGLIGLGSIGIEVAKRLKAFDVKIMYFRRTRLSLEKESELGLIYKPYRELIKEADILSFHLPLTAETKGMLGHKEINSMEKGTVIINTSRGGLIDEQAFIEALNNKTIGAAGLDVFWQEPIEENHPLLQLENVAITPHVGGGTIDTLKRTLSKAFNNIRLFEKGESPAEEDLIV